MKFLRLTALLFIACAVMSCDDAQNQSVEDLMKRAIDSRNNGKLRRSIIDLKNVLLKDSNFIDGRLLLGQIYLDVGDSVSAKKELAIALEFGSDTKIVGFLLARAKLLSGEHADVLKEYTVSPDQTFEIMSNHHLFRGKAHLARRELDMAEDNFQSARKAYKQDIEVTRPHLKITERPDLLEAIVGLTNIAIERRDYETAKTHLAQAVKLAPEDATVFAAKGEMAFNIKDYQTTVDAFSAAFKVNPYNLEYQIGISRAQLMLNRAEEAIANLTNVLKFYPDNIIANYYRGISALQNKNFEKATEVGDKLSKLRLNHHKAYMISGVASYGLGNFEQANLNLKRYLSHSPDDKKIRRILGLAQLQLTEHREALNTFKKLSEQSPKDVGLLSLVAASAAEDGDLILAEDYLRRAVDLKPDFEGARLQLAAVQLARGERDEALKEPEKQPEIHPIG